MKMTLPHDKKGHYRAIFFSCFASIGGFTFGYGIAVVSGAMLLIKHQFSLSTIWHEAIVSITLVGAAISSAVTGILADKFGRKPVLLFSSLLFTIGSVIVATADGEEGKVLLLIGRMIMGFGIGCSTMVVPLYISEVSAASVRGTLLTLYALMISIGILISSIANGLFSTDKESGWRYMFALGGVPSTMQFFGSFFLPETPVWLIKHGKILEGRETLNKIRGTENNNKEFTETLHAVSKSKEFLGKSMFQTLRKMLKNRPVRKALFLGCILQVYQQLCGINAVFAYSGTILRMAGFDNTMSVWLQCIPYTVSVIMTCVGVYAADKLGRRIMALLSLIGFKVAFVYHVWPIFVLVVYSGLVIASSVMGAGFLLSYVNSPLVLHSTNITDTRCQLSYRTCSDCIQDSNCGFCWNNDNEFIAGLCLSSNPTHPGIYAATSVNSSNSPCSLGHSAKEYTQWGYDFCPSTYSWLTVTGLVIFLLSFAPGIGPLAWTINSEIYPMWARGTGVSIATSVRWIANLVVSMTFLSLSERLTTYGTFFMFAAISATGFFLLLFILPETKGKTLQEVEKLFVISKEFPKGDVKESNLNTYL